MPELFLMAEKFVSAGDFANARKIQHDINDIIVALSSLNGSLYSTIKEILKQNGVHIGSVRAPLEPVSGDDLNKIASIKALIDNAIQKYKG